MLLIWRHWAPDVPQQRPSAPTVNDYKYLFGDVVVIDSEHLKGCPSKVPFVHGLHLVILSARRKVQKKKKKKGSPPSYLCIFLFFFFALFKAVYIVLKDIGVIYFLFLLLNN